MDFIARAVGVAPGARSVFGQAILEPSTLTDDGVPLYTVKTDASIGRFLIAPEAVSKISIPMNLWTRRGVRAKRGFPQLARRYLAAAPFPGAFATQA